MGLRNRGDVLERLFDSLFAAEGEDGDGLQLQDLERPGEADLDEQGALVLVERGGLDAIGAAPKIPVAK